MCGGPRISFRLRYGLPARNLPNERMANAGASDVYGRIVYTVSFLRLHDVCNFLQFYFLSFHKLASGRIVILCVRFKCHLHNHFSLEHAEYKHKISSHSLWRIYVFKWLGHGYVPHVYCEMNCSVMLAVQCAVCTPDSVQNLGGFDQQ